MDLKPPGQVFSTTLYDRYQPQSLSFVFVPARSMVSVPDLNTVKNLIDPTAFFFQTIAPSYLPAALASLLSDPTGPNPFSWAQHLSSPGHIWVEPNRLGFAEYVAYSESVPIEESPLKAKSVMAVAVTAGANIGLVAGGGTPFVLLTVPAGIILCTAGVVFGQALGEKLSRLIGA
jgi:hypothetical protein